MHVPEYVLIGAPRRYADGRNEKAKYYSQRYRLLHEPVRRIRSVSLKTKDGAAARRRAVPFVEAKIAKLVLLSDPQARTATNGICAALNEYVDHLIAVGNTIKQAKLVRGRIERIIAQAGFTEYAQLDSVKVAKAISELGDKEEFSTLATKNKYCEAARAWSRWMYRYGRWPDHRLELLPKFKGDTTTSRLRAILTDDQLTTLLTATRKGPSRRNLTGEQRFWLYLIAAQTGLRAQEMHSLSPKNFRLRSKSPHIELHCTVSKRRKTDRVELRPDFAKCVAKWLQGKPHKRRLWGTSEAWFDKAADMLRLDLAAAGLEYVVKTPDGPAVVDFHAFRALRVTQAILSGANSRVVLATVRLSSEALLDRYAKLPSSEVTACTMAIPLPSVLKTNQLQGG